MGQHYRLITDLKVAAGTFDTLRVGVHALDGAPQTMTLWFAKEARKMVKMTAATLVPAL